MVDGGNATDPYGVSCIVFVLFNFIGAIVLICLGAITDYRERRKKNKGTDKEVKMKLTKGVLGVLIVIALAMILGIP